jgi:23S rRNA (cytidine1920-2'-O)/16S rRNA (cytidine1409-2'-O)-methyltransferase
VTPRPAGKLRLDELVQRRCGVSRSKAQGLIRTGRVRGTDGEPLRRPGHAVPSDIELTIDEGPPYVSRGGIKLEAALDAFKLDVRGKIAIDAGASTGGFTDCLLQRGAAKVFAVDVGYGQLDWKLRHDPRVVVMERTNIRELGPQQLPDRPEFFTIDCSFISLRIVLPAVRALVADGAEGVALVKPQFEAGREEVGKGGVVRDAAVHQRVIADVRDAAERVGFDMRGVIDSPLEGPAGNREFLAHLVVRR